MSSVSGLRGCSLTPCACVQRTSKMSARTLTNTAQHQNRLYIRCLCIFTVSSLTGCSTACEKRASSLETQQAQPKARVQLTEQTTTERNLQWTRRNGFLGIMPRCCLRCPRGCRRLFQALAFSSASTVGPKICILACVPGHVPASASILCALGFAEEASVLFKL